MAEAADAEEGQGHTDEKNVVRWRQKHNWLKWTKASDVRTILGDAQQEAQYAAKTLKAQMRQKWLHNSQEMSCRYEGIKEIHFVSQLQS